VYLNQIRHGAGPGLLLLHGLGGSWRSWRPVLNLLATERRVIAVDLPGFGKTPPLAEDAPLSELADALCSFLTEHNLIGIDVAGYCLGGWLALELARRGAVGAAVAINPAGFAAHRRDHLRFAAVYRGARTLYRAARPFLPLLAARAWGRVALMALSSRRPWLLPPDVVLEEAQACLIARSFDDTLARLREISDPQGSERGRIIICWSENNYLCPPQQAYRALARFPHARLEWLPEAGHLAHWDVPQQTARLILDHTGDALSQPRAGSRPWLEHAL